MHHARSFFLIFCAGCFASLGLGGESSTETSPMFEAPPLKEELRLPGKKGACFTLRHPDAKKGGTWKQNMPKVQALKPYWNYSWGTERVPAQPPEIEFLPMIWSARNREQLADRLTASVTPRIKDGTVKRLLAFNEPDHTDQASMRFDKAIDLWPTLEALNIPLASPACANPEGINDPSAQGVPGTWMQDFMREVERRDLRVDYVAAHWYGGTHAESFKKKMWRIYVKYGRRPLLITEFAPADWKAKKKGGVKANRHSPARVLAFMKEVLPWMERQEWIAGYSWFSFSIDAPQGTSSALFDNDGQLTACGRYYASITNENPQGDQEIQPDPKR